MELPPTLVINLDNRPDRFEQVKESFYSWPLERVSAEKASPGWVGCIRSHRKAIEIAYKRGDPFAIVLEDDCELTENGLSRFKALFPYLVQTSADWDVFFGGPTFVDNIEVKFENPPLFQVGGYAAHFCLYNRRSMKKVLDGLTEHEPFDVYLRKHLRQWCTVPHIAVQAPSHSDIEGSEADYTPLFSSSQKSLEESRQLLEGFLSRSIRKRSSGQRSSGLLLLAFAAVLYLVFPTER